ncbi:MAG TPA: cysteine desulfurase NifS [Bacteroidales bacterium]|nr:cysteine desulfurase NifS [Bacteroidales bacterium]
MIYLDYNATTPIDKEVAEAMLPYLFEHFGNPSSSHKFGIIANQAVEKARKQLAELINCLPEEIIFTSGGTEANNFALKGAAFAGKGLGKHIITSNIEHPAITEVCEYLQRAGFEISYLPVDEFGILQPETVAKAIKPSTILISVMHANNETGSIQPIAEIGELAKKHNILFHSDAAQSMGKIEVDVQKFGLDMLSIAGHKLYAPKGVGALFVRKGVHLKRLLHGASHERNLRAGTENVLEIVGLGKAAEIAKQYLAKNAGHSLAMRNLLHTELVKNLPDTKLNGHPVLRLPNTLNVGFKGINASTLINQLENVACSAGAACHSHGVKISKVLEAMHIPAEYAQGTVRFSVGKYTTEEEIRQAVSEIVEQVQLQQKQ